ncbi:hypothetical protein IJ843_07330 [bacterium]|nr:hypothetical protein [bacterium]
MLLFAISFIFVFTSSYLISTILSKNNFVNCFVYTTLIAFSQLILTSELLSILHQIKVLPFLTFNTIFLIISLIVWLKTGKPTVKPKIKPFLLKCFNSMKLDKSLFILFFGWLFFIFVSIFLIIVLPATSGDAFAYHVTRSFDWIINQTIEHFQSADIRITTFPINSEILYMWVILLTKKQLFLGSFSFMGYILSIISCFQIFKYIGFSMRRTLWTLFIISSFASVIVMVSGTETDLIIAGLLTSSIYLFIDAVKNKSDKIKLYISSLSYAIAIGLKTPAIICIPAIGLLFLYMSFKYKDKNSLPRFILFGILNFAIFSAYNYVLNFLEFGNVMGHEGAIIAHKNLWGIKGVIASFIRHLFLIVDFSGIRIPEKYTELMFHAQTKFMNIIHLGSIPEGLYTSDERYHFNTSLLEPSMGSGIFSFILILPCLIISLLKPVFYRSRITIWQFIFALIYIINLISLSTAVVFMTYNTRFLTTFIIISAPIIACSYIKSNKNILKYIFIIIASIYFTVISTHLWSRPFFKIVNELSHKSLKEFRSEVICGKYDKRVKKLSEWCNIDAILESKFSDKKYKVLFMPNFSDEIIIAKTKRMQGYQYDFINAENLKYSNPNQYDIIIIPQEGQQITGFEKFTPKSIDYFLYYNPETKKPSHYPLNINDEIICYYNGIFGTLSREMGTENQIPITKACKLTSNFFYNHPFEFVYKTEKNFILLNTNTFPEFKRSEKYIPSDKDKTAKPKKKRKK